MLSRVAESVYWMNRQIERAENVARAVETTLDLALDGAISHGLLWNALVCTFGDQADFGKRHGHADQARVISFLAFDPENPNSIASCLRAARENARTVRDMISTPMWEEINKAHLEVQQAAKRYGGWLHPREFLDEVKRASQLITGVADATMSHGEAWHFGRLGRLVERADKTSRVLDVEHYFKPAAFGFAPPAGAESAQRSLTFAPPAGADGASGGSSFAASAVTWVDGDSATFPAGVSLVEAEKQAAAEPTNGDAVQWSAVLESASALEMYRKQYGAVSRRNVAEFLVFDRFFPRAMHFCLNKAEESLLAITGGARGAYTNPAEQRLGRLRSKLDYGSIDEVLAGPGGLHGFIDGFQMRVNRASDAIHDTFFAVRPVGKAAEAGV
jgi:uncharacterized alpha-E superfamily protein